MVQKLRRGGGDALDGVRERFLVGAGGLTEATDLADVLDGGCADLLFGGGRIKVVEGADVSTHAASVDAGARTRTTHHFPHRFGAGGAFASLCGAEVPLGSRRRGTCSFVPVRVPAGGAEGRVPPRRARCGRPARGAAG